MAIRLSRNLRNNFQQENSDESLNIAVTPGENYNLDDITNDRDRTSDSTPLVIENTQGSEEGISSIENEEGEISLSEVQDQLLTPVNQLDYIKYLLEDNQNKLFPHPPKYPKRQIVNWEEGSDDSGDEDNTSNLYYEFYERMLRDMADDENFMVTLLERLMQLKANISAVEIDKPEKLYGPIITILNERKQLLESNRIIKKDLGNDFFEVVVPFFADYVLNNIEGQFYEFVHEG